MQLIMSILIGTLFTSVYAPKACANVDLVFYSGCMGSLFMMEGSTLDQKALVLSAGHCTYGSYLDRFLNDGEVNIDVPINNTDAIVHGTGKKQLKSYALNRVIYGTMTKTDLAVFELKNTYREILNSNNHTTIYRISKKPASVGDHLVAHMAQQERNFQCVLENIVPEIKQFPWVWQNVLKFKLTPSCTFFHGVSGSPIFNSKSEIVGVANTINEGEGEPCSRRNLCEVDRNNLTTVSQKGQSYAVQTYQLYSCYDKNKAEFNFLSPACQIGH